MATDSYFYGRLVIAPYNIVFYNIFTSHGPNLYGTEDGYFYFFNGFLNFNIVFIIAFMVPVIIIARKVCLSIL